MTLDSVIDDLTRRDWETPTGGAVRIAVVGLGWFGRDVALPAIEESTGCEATVTVSGSLEKAERVADEAGLERGITYEEYHDGAAREEYDAVYIATPNALHLPYAETAADLGKHVLCEKPMEASVERAESMVEACAGAGVTLMVGYRMQTTPLVRGIRRLLRRGAIGEPVRVDGSFSFRIGDPDGWRLDAARAGGGALYDVGVYPINTARFVLDADPVAASADLASVHGTFDDVDEHAAVRLAFGDGLVADCHASYNAYGDNRFSVLGTGGRLEIAPVFGVEIDRTLALDREGGRSVVEDVPGDEVTAEFDYFAHCVLDGETPEPDGRDGLTDMRILAAVAESSAAGERVSL